MHLQVILLDIWVYPEYFICFTSQTISYMKIDIKSIMLQPSDN